MNVSAQRVAARWLSATKDPCWDGSTSYAWIDPRGKVYKIPPGGHEAWADAYLRKHHPDKYQEEVEDLRDEYPSPNLPYRSGSLAIKALLRDGWIRVPNAFAAHVYLDTVPSRKAWEAFVQMTIDCVVQGRQNPEQAFVYLEDVSDLERRSPVADFVERYGTRRQVAQMYEALMA